MDKKIKIAYCIPSLYYPSGMERVLTLKAELFYGALRLRDTYHPYRRKRQGAIL